jgi:hypothetical protein
MVAAPFSSGEAVLFGQQPPRPRSSWLRRPLEASAAAPWRRWILAHQLGPGESFVRISERHYLGHLLKLLMFLHDDRPRFMRLFKIIMPRMIRGLGRPESLQDEEPLFMRVGKKTSLRASTASRQISSVIGPPYDRTHGAGVPPRDQSLGRFRQAKHREVDL